MSRVRWKSAPAKCQLANSCRRTGSWHRRTTDRADEVELSCHLASAFCLFNTRLASFRESCGFVSSHSLSYSATAFMLAAEGREGASAEEEGSLFGELFLNQSYKLTEHTWEDPDGSPVVLRMHVSTAACTDYDLTGVCRPGGCSAWQLCGTGSSYF